MNQPITPPQAHDWRLLLLRRDSHLRRRPDETLLYRLVEEHWPSFLATERGLLDAVRNHG